MKHIKIDIHDVDGDFLFMCAGIRYCMGRRSYANSIGLDFLNKYWDKFSCTQQEKILLMIKQELDSRGLFESKLIGNEPDPYAVWETFFKNKGGILVHA